jgi:hypothetical protein
MEINSGSAINQGLIGMQRSQAEMVRSAQQIAGAGTTQSPADQSGDLVESLVNLKIQAQVFDSSARVVQSADETIGRLLDTKA